jgi:hypothetical protein
MSSKYSSGVALVMHHTPHLFVHIEGTCPLLVLLMLVQLRIIDEEQDVGVDDGIRSDADVGRVEVLERVDALGEDGGGGSLREGKQPISGAWPSLKMIPSNQCRRSTPSSILGRLERM